MAKQTDSTQHEDPQAGEVLVRGVKAAGEVLIVPGASLILDGRIGAGGAHLVGGLLARWALGPIGWLLVAANSYSQSTTKRHLHQHMSSSAESSSAAAS